MAKRLHEDLGVVLFVVNGVTRMRQLVVPRNPDTIKQRGHREGFKLSTLVAVNSLDLFINDLWKNVDVSISPYHSFVSVNGSRTIGINDFEKLLMTVGVYEPIFDIISVRYKDVMGRIIFRWSADVVGDGSPDDRIVLFAIDTTFWNKSTSFSLLKIYVAFGKLRRNRIGFILPLDIPSAINIKCYISVLSPLGILPGKISISKYKQCEDF